MWGKVAIGWRVHAASAPEFNTCIKRLIIQGLRQGDIVLDPAIHMPLVGGTNRIVNAFMDETICNSLLIFDDDMVFACNDVQKLRASGQEYGVLSALYASRRYPYNPNVFRSVYRNLNNIHDLNGVINVEAVGMGMTLIRREVVDALRKGYGKKDVFQWDRYGEDMAFCKCVRNMGFKVGLNCDVSIGHVTSSIVYWDAKTSKPEQRIWDGDKHIKFGV